MRLLLAVIVAILATACGSDATAATDDVAADNPTTTHALRFAGAHVRVGGFVPTVL